MENNEPKYAVKDYLKLDRELIENIDFLIEQGAERSLLNILMNLHPGDIAEIINNLNLENALFVFRILDTETAGEVITELDDNLRENILENIGLSKVADIVDELDTDDQTDIISELSEEVANHVLKSIDKEDSYDVKRLLRYAEDTAGGIMETDFVFVWEYATVKDAIDEVRRNSDDIENLYYIHILDHNNKLLGIVNLTSLLTNPLDTKITEIMEEDLIYVTPEVDQEEVASQIKKYDLVSIPVVDHNKTMLGRITVDDIVDVINEETSEDFQKFAGLGEDEELNYSVFKITRNRIPWLLIGLLGELVSASVLFSFEASIEKFVIASFFIPIVMAMAGSSATQSAIIMARGLTSNTFYMSNILKKLWKETRVGLLNGFICGIILMGVTYTFFDTLFLFSAVLSFSLLLVMTFATMQGAFMPIILKKFGADPASATGPILTTLNDVIGLTIYLSIVTMFFVTQ